MEQREEQGKTKMVLSSTQSQDLLLQLLMQMSIMSRLDTTRHVQCPKQSANLGNLSIIYTVFASAISIFWSLSRIFPFIFFCLSWQALCRKIPKIGYWFYLMKKSCLWNMMSSLFYFILSSFLSCLLSGHNPQKTVIVLPHFLQMVKGQAP